MEDEEKGEEGRQVRQHVIRGQQRARRSPSTRMSTCRTANRARTPKMGNGDRGVAIVAADKCCMGQGRGDEREGKRPSLVVTDHEIGMVLAHVVPRNWPGPGVVVMVCADLGLLSNRKTVLRTDQEPATVGLQREVAGHMPGAAAGTSAVAHSERDGGEGHPLRDRHDEDVEERVREPGRASPPAGVSRDSVGASPWTSWSRGGTMGCSWA